MHQAPDTEDPIQPAWVRANLVAPTLGFTVELMTSAIAAGQLPIRTFEAGPRGLLYLHRRDVLAYLQSLLPTEGTPA